MALAPTDESVLTCQLICSLFAALHMSTAMPAAVSSSSMSMQAQRQAFLSPKAIHVIHGGSTASSCYHTIDLTALQASTPLQSHQLSSMAARLLPGSPLLPRPDLQRPCGRSLPSRPCRRRRPSSELELHPWSLPALQRLPLPLLPATRLQVNLPSLDHAMFHKFNNEKS